MRRTLFITASALLSSSLLACGPTQAPEAKAPEAELPPPTLSELLPLVDGTVSNFATESDLGDTGVLVLEIFRPRPEMAELKIAGTVRRLIVAKNRISQSTGGTLLEEPLQVGHTFEGSFGTTKITSVAARVELPAGTFEQCLVTVEESTRPPKRATSTYCRNVGLVSLVIESFGGDDAGRLETRLLHHGRRVNVHDPASLEAPKSEDQ